MDSILFVALLLLWVFVGPMGVILWLIEVMRPRGHWSFENNNPNRVYGTSGWLLFSAAVTVIGGLFIFSS